jgi:hypothetical protein
MRSVKIVADSLTEPRNNNSPHVLFGPLSPPPWPNRIEREMQVRSRRRHPELRPTSGLASPPDPTIMDPDSFSRLLQANSFHTSVEPNDHRREVRSMNAHQVETKPHSPCVSLSKGPS